MKRIGIGRAKQAALHKPFRKVLFEQLNLKRLKSQL